MYDERLACAPPSVPLPLSAFASSHFPARCIYVCVCVCVGVLHSWQASKILSWRRLFFYSWKDTPHTNMTEMEGGKKSWQGKKNIQGERRDAFAPNLFFESSSAACLRCLPCLSLPCLSTEGRARAPIGPRESAAENRIQQEKARSKRFKIACLCPFCALSTSAPFLFKTSVVPPLHFSDK